MFQNLACNISPNYEANETKLGRLLGPPTVLGIWKFGGPGTFGAWERGAQNAIFQKVRFFGAIWRRNASTCAELSINLNTTYGVLLVLTLSLKLGRGETIVEIQKFAFFGKMGIFQI